MSGSDLGPNCLQSLTADDKSCGGKGRVKVLYYKWPTLTAKNRLLKIPLKYYQMISMSL